MLFGALGDIHGDFASVRRIMRRHQDVPFWVCVGDLADDRGRYEPVDAPLYWIKGNNENFDLIAAGAFPDNLHYLPNARPVRLSGVTIAGLGGTLAPTWYDTTAAELPHPVKRTGKATELADRRRHFVREEVEACKALRGVDLFLTHEAPRPYIVGGRPGGRGIDAGKTPVNEILAALKPRVHLFGHHHRFSDEVRQQVRSVGLDQASKSYLLIESGSMDLTKKETGVSTDW
jgi:Icc-related predicted phosphoesterase